LTNLNWQDKATCVSADLDMFFQQADNGRYTHYKKAKAYCDICPVSTECLDYALCDPQMKGIWAGTTESDRANMREDLRSDDRFYDKLYPAIEGFAKRVFEKEMRRLQGIFS
jgi:WhiB family redox-sensing transcriptional regulator